MSNESDNKNSSTRLSLALWLTHLTLRPAPSPSLYLSLTFIFKTARDTRLDDVCVCVSAHCMCVSETGWQASSHPYRASQLFLCFDRASMCVCVCVWHSKWARDGALSIWHREGESKGDNGDRDGIKIYFTFNTFLWGEKKESEYIHGREWFLSLCFTHTSMDAPLSPPYRLVFHSSHIYSGESLLERKM